MKRLTATLCLTIAVLLGSSSVGTSDEWKKGATAFESGNLTMAVQEWTPLARQGDFRAQSMLCALYSGPLKDYINAFSWCKIAAERGSARAQAQLSYMYALGEGTLRNRIYAYMWGEISAANGIQRGGKIRDLVMKLMTSNEIAKAQTSAHNCVRKRYIGC